MKGKFKNIWIKAILQVLIVIFLHFITIYFLKMKTGNWDEEIVKQMFIMYLAPIILMYMSCMMALKTEKLRYNIAWLVISILPSMRILFYLKEELKGREPEGSGFIEFSDVASEQLVLNFLFPVSYLGIQLILIFIMLIMILSKEKPVAD
ncbi:hypothetical protein [Paenibacillus sp.]|uniref:hypothetical protein n=1 Tax=Paenibacillus sp. TaxID=58172 RepID=UPI0028AB9D61|nr:hypothetical protein [Paenibacillus sp.]